MTYEKKTIPEIRERLVELAEHLHNISCEVQQLAADTLRRPPVRRAKTEGRPVTPVLKARIRAYAKAYPHASYKNMAELFGVNQGRISEVLAGKRNGTQ